MMNEVVEITEVMIEYEDEGFMETESMTLMVADCKFYFRDRDTGELTTVEYPYIERKYDRVDYTDEEIEQMEFCIKVAQELGFFLEV